MILGIKKADLIHYIKSYDLEKEFEYDSKSKKNN